MRKWFVALASWWNERPAKCPGCGKPTPIRGLACNEECQADADRNLAY